MVCVETKVMKTRYRVGLMFESGMDTYAIAQALDLHESNVSAMLHYRRCKMLGRPYEVRTRLAPSVDTQQWHNAHINRSANKPNTKQL